MLNQLNVFIIEQSWKISIVLKMAFLNDYLDWNFLGKINCCEKVLSAVILPIFCWGQIVFKTSLTSNELLVNNVLQIYFSDRFPNVGKSSFINKVGRKSSLVESSLFDPFAYIYFGVIDHTCWCRGSTICIYDEVVVCWSHWLQVFKVAGML